MRNGCDSPHFEESSEPRQPRVMRWRPGGQWPNVKRGTRKPRLLSREISDSRAPTAAGPEATRPAKRVPDAVPARARQVPSIRRGKQQESTKEQCSAPCCARDRRPPPRRLFGHKPEGGHRGARVTALTMSSSGPRRQCCMARKGHHPRQHRSGRLGWPGTESCVRRHTRLSW